MNGVSSKYSIKKISQKVMILFYLYCREIYEIKIAKS